MEKNITQDFSQNPNDILLIRLSSSWPKKK